MDFFEAQAHARRRTARLMALFALAVLGTIALSYVAAMILLRGGHAGPGASWYDPNVLAYVAVAVVTVVVCGSLYKWLQFRAGGAVVAERVGGRRVDAHTSDFHERRLLDVVEEMAIASGVPVPSVYVMDAEPGINAFAAGLTTSDAVVTVTRGTLQKLDRDELQGVIAHEFSHILNGDMRLNVKLAAILFCILVIGLAGRGILWGMGRGRMRVGGRGRGAGGIAVIIAIGLALLVIGYIGYFFGRLIQAAVSRQREFLADASAVQFTRNPDGICGALRKIGGYAIGSSLSTHRAAEIGHFFFAEGFRSALFGALWATHPPLAERLRAIDPRWDGRYYQPPDVVDVSKESFRRVGYGAPPLPPTEALRRAYNLAPPATPAPIPASLLAPATVLAQVGSVTSQHVDRARALLDATPERLRIATRRAAEAPALIYGLLLDPGSPPGGPAFAALSSRTDDATVGLVRELLPALAGMPVDARLPLAQLTLPALRQLSAAERNAFAATCRALIAADQQLSCFEFALQKVVLRHLAVAAEPAARLAQIYSFNAIIEEIAVLLSALAWAGAIVGPEQSDGTADADPGAARTAFLAGASRLPVIANRLSLLPPDRCEFPRLDAALDKLAGGSLPIKQRLLFASACVVSQDNKIREEEGELLRAVADTLGCPVPPLLAETAVRRPPVSPPAHSC